MIQQDIMAGRGVVFIDAKGSTANANAIFEMVQKAGREKDFVFFSLTDLEHSCSYNPLQHGNAAQLKDKIVAGMDWTEPYYLRASESALLTLFTEMEQKNKKVTLPELHRILKNSQQSPFKNFADFASKNEKDISSLFHEINTLVNTPFGELFHEEQGQIDFLDIYQNQKIAYFALDTQSYQSSAMRLGRMITQDLNILSGIIESKIPKSMRNVV